MKNSKTYIFTLIILCGLFTLPSTAQIRIDTTKFKLEIDKGFNSFKEKYSQAIENQIELKWKRGYYEGLMNLQPKKEGARGKELKQINITIKYLTTSSGVEELVARWFAIIDPKNENVYLKSIDELLDSWVMDEWRENNIDYEKGIPTGIRNKYAILFVIDKSENPNSEIYIDDEYVSTIGESKNGIRVQSGIHYSFELRFQAKRYCKMDLIFGGQERKSVQCSISQ